MGAGTHGSFGDTRGAGGNELPLSKAKLKKQ